MNKSLRRITAAQRGRCFAPCAARQERRGVLEYSLGWDYVYTVDGEEYRKSQMMSVTFKLWKEDEMAVHIGEKLVVHYAPDHPEISWAETPERRT